MKFNRLLSVIELVRDYKKGDIKSDLAAGISTGMLLIPQAMAYAVIAGVPVQYGLYAAFIAPLVYIIFGTSTKLVLGPAALDSMLIASSLALITVGFDETQYISYVFATVLLTGLFQILFSVLKLGFISNFFSKPLLTGFTTGAAFLIAYSQLKNVLGIHIQKTSFFHELVINALQNIKETSINSLFLGIGTLVAIFILKRINLQKISTPLVVIISIVINYFFDLSSIGIATVGEIPNGMPVFMPFDLSDVVWFDIITPAIVLAIIGFTISMSITKVTEENPNLVRPNHELFALGIANITGFLFGGYQASSSFSRTAINKESGAKTRLSNLSSSLIIALVLLFFTNIFQLLPMPVLGGVIISAMPGLMKFSDFKKTYELDKREFIVLIVTFLVTIELGVIYGFGIGVLVSGGVFLFNTLQPHIAVLGRIGETDIFKNINRFDTATENENQVIIRIDGSIYFANVKFILASLRKSLKSRPNVKHIILHAEAINYIDITGFSELQEFILSQKSQGKITYLSAVQGPLRDMFYQRNFNENLGGKTLFLNLTETISFIEKGTISNHEIANQFDRK